MSHAPERTEKNCLNCGTIVQGRYCHKCGQENIVPKESFWSLVVHFFYDITHFDSKFFDSLKYLLFKPGFLSKEYMNGRRAAYLNPVRMYVFTSFFFFLVFFTVFKSDDAIRFTGDEVITAVQRDSILVRLNEQIAQRPNSAALLEQKARVLDTTKPLTMMEFVELSEDFQVIDFTGEKYISLQEYDSIQNSLPKSKRDGWFIRLVEKRKIELNQRYRARSKEALKDIGDLVLHKLPYLLFISLPLFAFLLKILYIRRKQFFYADHGIFTIHHYIFSFLNLLFILGFNKLESITGWSIFSWLSFALVILWFVYLYKGLRNFYQQGRGKTIVKFLLLNLGALIVNIILLALFFLFSVFTI